MGRKLRVFLDSDIFIRDLRFKRDEHYKENEGLLQLVKEKKILGYTSIYNLLEICGYLSFNLDPAELKNLYNVSSTKELKNYSSLQLTIRTPA